MTKFIAAKNRPISPLGPMGLFLRTFQYPCYSSYTYNTIYTYSNITHKQFEHFTLSNNTNLTVSIILPYSTISQDQEQDPEAASPTADIKINPMDCSVNLSVHQVRNLCSLPVHLPPPQPLYPPGRIIHIVRHHPDRG